MDTQNKHMRTTYIRFGCSVLVTDFSFIYAFMIKILITYAEGQFKDSKSYCTHQEKYHRSQSISIEFHWITRWLFRWNRFLWQHPRRLVIIALKGSLKKKIIYILIKILNIFVYISFFKATMFPWVRAQVEILQNVHATELRIGVHN